MVKARKVEVTVPGDPERVFVEGGPEDACQHPSGFLFLGKVSPDGVTVLDLTRCPHCGERRRETANGRVVASCAAGGEWVPWQ